MLLLLRKTAIRGKIRGGSCFYINGTDIRPGKVLPRNLSVCQMSCFYDNLNDSAMFCCLSAGLKPLRSVTRFSPSLSSWWESIRCRRSHRSHFPNSTSIEGRLTLLYVNGPDSRLGKVLLKHSLWSCLRFLSFLTASVDVAEHQLGPGCLHLISAR